MASSAGVSSVNVPSTPSSAAVTFHNSDYDLWDAWLHKICE